MALTKGDLDKIDQRLDKRIEIRLKNQKDEILDVIDKKLIRLRSDFFDKIDPFLKEITTARKERPLIENRPEALEEIHRKGKHVLAS